MQESPALSKSSFCKLRKFLLQKKCKITSFSSASWSPWQSLSGRPPRRQRESACWSQGRGFDCRAVPATHREALSFEIWVSGRKIFVSKVTLWVAFGHNLYLSWGSRRSSLHFPCSPESFLLRVLRIADVFYLRLLSKKLCLDLAWPFS